MINNLKDIEEILKDLEENEVYEIVLKNIERLGKIDEDFKKELKDRC